MQLGQQRGSIHHRNHGRARRGCLTGKERPIRHYPGNRTADFGIAQLRLGPEVLALGRSELALCALERSFMADLLDSVEMLLGDIVCGLGLHQRSFGSIQIASWDCTF